GPGLLGERPRAFGIAVRDGEVAHRRMLGGEPRPQGADAAGANDADAEIAALHAGLPTARRNLALDHLFAAQSRNLPGIHSELLPQDLVRVLAQPRWRTPHRGGR